MKNRSIFQDFAVGQVRKLDSIKGIASARLVAIAEIDPLDATCLVFLLSNSTDAATPRDVIIPKEISKLSYEIALMGDYLSRADQGRLVNNPVLAELGKDFIDAVRKAVIDSPFGQLNIEETKFSISIGSYPAQKYDPVWNFRDGEALNFELLTFVRNRISTDFAYKFLQVNIENPLAFSEPEVPFDALRLRSISSEKIEVAA